LIRRLNGGKPGIFSDTTEKKHGNKNEEEKTAEQQNHPWLTQEDRKVPPWEEKER